AGRATAKVTKPTRGSRSLAFTMGSSWRRDSVLCRGGRAAPMRFANPKSEARNPKQIPIRQKEAMTETEASSVSVIALFGFRICFGFRASDFGFSPPRDLPRHFPPRHLQSPYIARGVRRWRAERKPCA